MRKRHIGFDLIEHDSPDSLPEADRILLSEAGAAQALAYSPYSDYPVGAAIRLTDGSIVRGCNQENASFPAGLCAERVAVFQAGVRFPGIALEVLAVRVRAGDNSRPAAPCGNCRQSLLEFELRQGRPMRILMQSGHGPVYECGSVSALLPLGFGPDSLM